MSVRIRKTRKKIVTENLSVKDVLNEQAVNRKAYIKKVSALYPTLISHWCLCRYCYLFDKDNRDFEHWVREVRNCIGELKYDYAPTTDKKEVLTKIWIGNKGLDVPSQVKIITREKIKKEGLLGSTFMDVVYQDCANNIKGLINVISDDEMDIKDYLSEYFGLDIEAMTVEEYRNSRKTRRK